jgi:MFS family permease
VSFRGKFHTFYAFIALRWFRLTSAIWMLYLLHSGWVLWEVGVAEGVFHVVGFVAGLPTGAYADRVGRRRSLIIGLILAVIAGLGLFALAPVSVPGAMAAMGLSSLSWSFISGADYALLYDLVEEAPVQAGAFQQALSGMNVVALVSGSAAAVLGGWLATHWGWIWAYGFGATAEGLAIPLVFLLPSGKAGSGVSHQPPLMRSLVDTLRDAAGAVRASPGLSALILFGAGLGVVATSNHLYAQTTLVLKRESVVAATAVIALQGLLAALSSALSQRVPGPSGGGARVLRLGSLVLAAVVAGIGAANGWLTVLLLAASGFVDGGLDVLYVAELGGRSPDAVRATVLSAPDTLFSLGMICCFPLEGWAMGQWGLPPVYLGLGILLAVATILLMRHETRWRVAWSRSRTACTPPAPKPQGRMP